MKWMKLSVLPALLALAACGSSSDNPATGSIVPTGDNGASGSGSGYEQLLVGRWVLQSLERTGAPAVTPPAGVTLAAEFQADGRLGVRADCNVCSAGYQAGNGDIGVTPMACTLAYCASAPLDTQFTGMLQASQHWKIGGDQLTLHSDQGTLTLRR